MRFLYGGTKTNKDQQQKTRYDPTTTMTQAGNEDDDEAFLDDMEEQFKAMSMTEQQQQRGRRRRNLLGRRKKLIIGMAAVVVLGIIIGVSFFISHNKHDDDDDDDGDNNKDVSKTETPSTSTGGIVLTPLEDLPALCSSDAISDEQGRSLCMKICEPGDCCTFPTSLDLSCLEENLHSCMIYNAACQNLFISSNTNFIGGEIGGDIAPAPSGLDVLCSSSNIATTSGLEACQDACKEAECCTATEDEFTIVKNCYFSHLDVCETYSPCMILTAPDINKIHEDISDEVQRKCEAIGTSLQNEDIVIACQVVCAPAFCCFVEGDGSSPTISKEGSVLSGITTCASDAANMPWCAQYDSCKGLITYLDQNGDKNNKVQEDVRDDEKHKTEIDVACSDGWPSGKAWCETLCEPGACCYATYEPDTCVQIGANVNCYDYSACEVLY